MRITGLYGHGDCGKSETLNVLKELLRENGYGCGEWSLLMTSTSNPSALTTICNTFVTKNVKKIKPPKQEKTEDTDILLLDKEEVLRLMERGEIS